MEEEEERITAIQVPEEFIRNSAKLYSEKEPNNILVQFLSASEQYKEAGMTPVFLYNFVDKNISLITLETYGKKLH